MSVTVLYCITDTLGDDKSCVCVCECEWICLTVLQMNNVLAMSPFVPVNVCFMVHDYDDTPTQCNDIFVLECVVT